MSKILVITDIYFESQYLVDNITDINTFHFSYNIENRTGSKMLNAARVFSKLGNSTYIYGKVGDDYFGNIATDTIKNEYSLNTKYLQVSSLEDKHTGQISVITDKNGNSSITLYAGVNTLYNLDDVKKLSNIISEFDLIYCCSDLPLIVLYKIIEEANNKFIRIFIELPNKLKELDLERLSSADFIASNRQEAETILGMKIVTILDAKFAVSKFREKVKGNIIITLDKDGCVLLEKGSTNPHHFSTIQTEQIDAIGSGDIFRAVFVSKYISINIMEDSIKNTLDVATRSIKIKGVSNTIKELDLF